MHEVAAGALVVAGGDAAPLLGAVKAAFDDVRQPVGVRTPDGQAWNPLGKVVNRSELGPDESAYELFLLVPRRPKLLPLSRGTVAGPGLTAAQGDALGSATRKDQGKII
ncbi:hypothetical protein OG392_31555 [Streptomyces sp. NBC_00691]|nr:hypothetical protein [Streptomyces sp. NBC_00691]